MPKTALTQRFRAAFAALAAASRAANAVESSRTPRGEDLRTLGIDPATFSRIGR